MVIVLLAVGITALNIFVLARLARNFRLLAMRSHGLSKKMDIPTVTVCIPVRNEVHAMSACLDRVVASDYPKLEVIVLDDASHDKTSVLVKSYASAGVRFIENKKLPAGWLGKNYAQNLLAREASGSVVFFIDVDTYIKTDTVSKAVAYMLAEKADMVSIIPQRDDVWRASTIFATLRHFWTIIRFTTAAPRATCNAWLIKRDVLLDRFDTDASLPQSFQVESSLARSLAPQHAYRLVLSNRELGVYYEKRWHSQVETAVRILYPQCGRSVLQALGLLLGLVVVLVPFGLLVVDPVVGGLLILLEYALYSYYLSRVRVGSYLLLSLALPYVVLQEVYLIIASMHRHRTGTVTWKGRPIETPTDTTATVNSL